MAYSVDWTSRVVTVPRADMTLVQSSPVEIRELDADVFRLTLKGLEAGEGMPHLDIHRHTAPTTLAGVTYARFVEVINGYTIEFEPGIYTVNVIGGNTNLGDVRVPNTVSLNTANSAGLVVGGGGAGGDVWDALLSSHQTAGSAGWVLQRVLDLMQAKVTVSGGGTLLQLRHRDTDALLDSVPISGGNAIDVTVG